MPPRRPPGAPPSAALAAVAARALALAVLALVASWVSSLGGVAARPDAGGKTARLFNWHPVLMTLAFPVLMSEALLSYRAPMKPGIPRPQRKVIHWVCHSLAAVCVAAGLSAVWRSHDLAEPPIPNLYSPHSFLGMAAVVLFGLQFTVGLYSYLWPQASLGFRESLGPVHRFLGQGTYLAGLAAVGAGLQEKATFLQLGAGKGVYSFAIRAPAWAAALLVPLALAALWPQAPPAQGPDAAGSVGSGVPHQPLPSHEPGDEAVLQL